MPDVEEATRRVKVIAVQVKLRDFFRAPFSGFRDSGVSGILGSATSGFWTPLFSGFGRFLESGGFRVFGCLHFAVVRLRIVPILPVPESVEPWRDSFWVRKEVAQAPVPTTRIK